MLIIMVIEMHCCIIMP